MVQDLGYEPTTQGVKEISIDRSEEGGGVMKKSCIALQKVMHCMLSNLEIKEDFLLNLKEVPCRKSIKVLTKLDLVICQQI